MTDARTFEPDPQLDLVLERLVPVRPELLWKAWTEAEHLKQWFCPKPWTVAECELDPVPGGVFRTVMRSPEGQLVPNSPGCFLEVVLHRRLVFTDALLPGYRPSGKPFFSVIVTFSPEGDGTRYRALARHVSPESCRKHEEMGFYDGWGTALDQLVELARSLDG